MGQQQKFEIWELVGSYPTCSQCGSNKVVRGAWTEWDIGKGEWVLKSIFDEFGCDVCGERMTPEWKLDEGFRKKRIKRLNDALRRGEGSGNTVVVTLGVKAKGDVFLSLAAQAVAGFSSFSKDNDPHGEHDFGAFDLQGEKLFWKIDYFDGSLSFHSPDPANQNLTNRVLTIMLASEY